MNKSKPSAVNKNFPIAVCTFVMILISALLCLSGVYAFYSSAEKSDIYERLDYEDETLAGSIDTLQEAALKRLNASDVTEDGALMLFSDAQLAKFKAAREGGKLEPLTLEDIRFLINDSVVLYNKFDKIVIKELKDAQPSDKDEIITPYHGDFSELSDKEQRQKVESMKQDIFKIIQYRISVLDGGYQAYKMYGDLTAGGEDFSLEIDNARMCTVFEKDGKRAVRYLDDLLCYSDAYLEENGFIHGCDTVLIEEETDGLFEKRYERKQGLGIRCFADNAATDREAAFSEYEIHRSLEWAGIYANDIKPAGSILLFSPHYNGVPEIILADQNGNRTVLFPNRAMEALYADNYIEPILKTSEDTL